MLYVEFSVIESYTPLRSLTLACGYRAALTEVPLQAILHSEGHVDDGLTLSRSQREESGIARLIRTAVHLFTAFVRFTHSTILASCSLSPQRARAVVCQWH
jgi:hypothetical protein